MSAPHQSWSAELGKWVGQCGWCSQPAPCDNPHHRWMDAASAGDITSLAKAHDECLAVRARRAR